MKLPSANEWLWFGDVSGKPETFHSLFAYFSLCRNFVRELLTSIGVPDTANYFAKEMDLFDTTVRLFFVVVGFACVLCSRVYPEHTLSSGMLLWRMRRRCAYIVFALYSKLCFSFFREKNWMTKKCATHTNLFINWMRFSSRYCRIWRQHQTHNKPCKLSPVT